MRVPWPIGVGLDGRSHNLLPCGNHVQVVRPCRGRRTDIGSACSSLRAYGEKNTDALTLQRTLGMCGGS